MEHQRNSGAGRRSAQWTRITAGAILASAVTGLFAIREADQHRQLFGVLWAIPIALLAIGSRGWRQREAKPYLNAQLAIAIGCASQAAAHLVPVRGEWLTLTRIVTIAAFTVAAVILSTVARRSLNKRD